ncbi:amidohydrolase family protein [Paracoccus yeei]|uniref:amidohydrolase family protein n=1 Tax=Paracoccus yeei TaxID=147645 RepID=UPI00048EEE4A|nr:amidohydrolase family protein [Paracoccus yeei]OWJ98534.1 4-hydroxyphenyl-beta-ketoacyl-CoA hydrolase [Paracoccus yeei]
MIDLAAVRAIDFHTHAEEPCGCHADDGYDDLQSAMARYFRAPWAHPPTIDQTAAHYRAQNIAAVIFPVDAERETGYRRYANEEVAEACARHSDILIPFASIDPARGRMGAREARRLIADHGIRGFKFHPTMQGFYPNDRTAYPLYEAIAEAGLPALFHTGQTGVGAGMRGGNGMRLKYSNPMHLDDVAVDFPDMPIVLAHPSFPWQDEALAVATHKPNVWIDLSGWRPKYFPPILVRYADTLLRDRVLFGSDWPMIAPEGWLEEFEALPIKPENRPGILKGNAARLLGLKEMR